jgi:hypothetical protein
MKFKIGTWVEVKAKVFTCFNNDGSRTIESSPLFKPIIGQIVGAKRKHEGQLRDWNTHEDFFSTKPEWYLESSGTKLVWLVRQGIMNKPIEAFEEDIKLFICTTHIVLPDIHRYQWKMNEEDRNMLRKKMKNVPRDSKGRWMKMEKSK